ncbi:MAG: lipid-A-disaccharide synthase [Bacteroidota bacterium]
MRYYLVAGEKSGDTHGGRLIQALRQADPRAELRCWGGACMQQASGKVVVHYRELAPMGLAFLCSLRKMFKYLQYCQKDLLNFQPDVVILIDYGGFNLRVARFAKKYNIKTFYYIPPKIWAWNYRRVYKIKAYVDRVFSIFPFEQGLYKKYDYEIDYVGNPLVEQVKLHKINPSFLAANKLDERPIIALLPGSRVQEVKRMLPTMLSIVSSLSTYQFVVAATADLPAELYEEAKKIRGVRLIYNQMYDVLAHAYAAVVTAGTATLEAALFHVPQVVVYRTDALTYRIAKWLVQLQYIALVNIIAGKAVVSELIQHSFNTQGLIKALCQIIGDTKRRKSQLAGYRRIKQMLGESQASERTARLMVRYLGAR